MANKDTYIVQKILILDAILHKILFRFFYDLFHNLSTEMSLMSPSFTFTGHTRMDLENNNGNLS